MGEPPGFAGVRAGVMGGFTREGYERVVRPRLDHTSAEPMDWSAAGPQVAQTMRVFLDGTSAEALELIYWRHYADGWRRLLQALLGPEPAPVAVPPGRGLATAVAVAVPSPSPSPVPATGAASMAGPPSANAGPPAAPGVAGAAAAVAGVGGGQPAGSAPLATPAAAVLEAPEPTEAPRPTAALGRQPSEALLRVLTPLHHQRLERAVEFNLEPARGQVEVPHLADVGL